MIENLKIIELSSVLAGPSVGMFFAELGAQVIKVENKSTEGDITRNWFQPKENKAGQSAYFSSVNWGKKHIFLNLYERSDFNEVKKLIQDADIVITNFKYGDAEKFKLSFIDCKKINPSIIYAHIGGFKSNQKRVAFDAIVQAETGFISMNGNPNSDGAKMPVAMMDILAAHQLKEGILVALLKQQSSKKAYHVSTTLEESGYSSLANQASNYLMNNDIAKKMGSLHPNIAPYGEKVTTKDNEEFLLAIGTEKQFKDFSKFIGLDKNIITKFSTNQKRVQNRKQLISCIQQKVSQINSTSFFNNCLKLNIPVGRIKTMDNVFDNPVAKEMILKEKIGNQETKRIASIAFTITC